MISDFLVSKFIKDNDNTTDKSIRNKYGYLAGVVGIITNLVLFIVKFSVGTFTSSVSISADAFNNLSDMASSVVTIIGFKLANIPADKEHPFGHGRLEYISALIVAFMVMFVGVEFIKSSIDKILNPQTVEFALIPFILLVFSILVKFWLSRFNKFVGEKINSTALKAAAVDALGDVFSSSCVVLAYLASNFISFPIDGYVGVLVSLAIIYAGFNLVKETISPLLGEAPDPELVSQISESVLSYEHITGIHDLIVHNYGVGKCLASIHAEIPADIDVMTIHEVIDKAEREVSEKLDVHLVIHMDPICVETEEVVKARDEIEDIINSHEAIKSMHDFRIVGKGDKKSLVFDMVVFHSKKYTDEELKEYMIQSIKNTHPHYNCIITVDKDYN